MGSLTFTGGSGDCFCDEVSFQPSPATAEMLLGGTNIASGMNVWAWIPFANIDLPQGVPIDSATVYWTASRSRSDAARTLIGCEDADNPSTPTSKSDLQGRVMTSSYNTQSPIEAYVAGTEYGYDITGAVQEVLNRPGWAYGNTLAVYCDNLPTNDYRRYIAAYENGTYAAPRLVITFSNFKPRITFF